MKVKKGRENSAETQSTNKNTASGQRGERNPMEAVNSSSLQGIAISFQMTYLHWHIVKEAFFNNLTILDFIEAKLLFSLAGTSTFFS